MPEGVFEGLVRTSVSVGVTMGRGGRLVVGVLCGAKMVEFGVASIAAGGASIEMDIFWSGRAVLSPQIRERGLTASGKQKCKKRKEERFF